MSAFMHSSISAAEAGRLRRNRDDGEREPLRRPGEGWWGPSEQQLISGGRPGRSNSTLGKTNGQDSRG